MHAQKFNERHPYLFVIILEIIILAVAAIVGTITKKMGLPDYMLYGGTMLVLAAITALILWKMKWWETIGFRRLNKKHIYLLVIPALPMIGNMLGSYKQIEIGFYIYYLLLNLLVGFVEEGIYRGLMLRVLLKKGVWKAVIITSMLFSLSHIMNALAGWNWLHVLLQLGYAFAFGFGWAAFALRTGAIWPLMLVHFLGNFFSFIKAEDLIKSLQSSEPGLSGIIYGIILIVVFIIYGVVVIRGYIKEERIKSRQM